MSAAWDGHGAPEGEQCAPASRPEGRSPVTRTSIEERRQAPRNRRLAGFLRNSLSSATTHPLPYAVRTSGIALAFSSAGSPDDPLAPAWHLLGLHLLDRKDRQRLPAAGQRCGGDTRQSAAPERGAGAAPGARAA